MPTLGRYSHLHMCVYALVLLECEYDSTAGLHI